MPEEPWKDVCNIVQEAVAKTTPKKKKCKKTKWLSEETLQIAEEEKQKAREKGKNTSNWMQSSIDEKGEIRKHS